VSFGFIVSSSWGLIIIHDVSSISISNHLSYIINKHQGNVLYHYAIVETWAMCVVASDNQLTQG